MPKKCLGSESCIQLMDGKKSSLSTKSSRSPRLFCRVSCAHRKKSIDQITKLSGKDGLFVDKLNNEQSRRPNIWCIQIKEGETMSSYFTRAHAEAKKENSSLCFRKGGSTCLGLRLQEKQAHATATCMDPHSAPKHWFGQDVMQCLFDAGCQEAAIINSPRTPQVLVNQSSRAR